jgi:hypothetical protein
MSVIIRFVLYNIEWTGSSENAAAVVPVHESEIIDNQTVVLHIYAAPRLCVGFSSHVYYFTQFIFISRQFQFCRMSFHCYILPEKAVSIAS